MDTDERFLKALAKTFGVASAIMNDVTIPPTDKEDLAVGSSGLTSGRDRDLNEPSLPRDASKWVSVSMRRNSISGATSPGGSPAQPATAGSNVAIWLPKSRETVNIILDAYFTRLNFHRPVLLRHDFENTLDKLYNGEAVPHDPGFVCCTYLVFALGTLSELNHRVSKLDSGGQSAAAVGGSMKALMPPDWPEHEEFFQLALSVKPDLRVTVSSLQALILLQWYLYTEVSIPLHPLRASAASRAASADLLTETGTCALASGREPCPPCHRAGVAPRPDLARQRVLSGRVPAPDPLMGYCAASRPRHVDPARASACHRALGLEHAPAHPRQGVRHFRALRAECAHCGDPGGYHQFAVCADKADRGLYHAPCEPHHQEHGHLQAAAAGPLQVVLQRDRAVGQREARKACR